MPTVDTEELLAKPLDTIESLRADLEAAAHDDSDDGVENQKASSALARAVSEALLAGPTPALSRVPVLSRKAFGEVGYWLPSSALGLMKIFSRSL